MRPVGLSVEEFQKDPAHTRKLMIEQAERAVNEDFAEPVPIGNRVWVE